MKKIAIVTNNSWYAWNMRLNLGFALQKQGYEVVFICPYDKYSKNIKEYFKYFDISNLLDENNSQNTYYSDHVHYNHVSRQIITDEIYKKIINFIDE